eukprot:scaffold179020_cov41-Attheya_sp.AAC.1
MADKTEEEPTRKVPEKAKRRQNNIVHFGNEDFPAMQTSKNTMTANKQQKKSREEGPSENHESDTDTNTYKQKLQKSEENFKAQLKATTESTDRKLIAMSNDHAKSMETQATTFKRMLDEQAAANKAMIEVINKSNQENQAEMRAQQKQDNVGKKELMATMIGGLKAELTVIMMSDNNPEGMGHQQVHHNTGEHIYHMNHHHQQPPFNANNIGYEHLPASNQITPPPHVNPNQGQNQLR